ncbi:MAG: [FeFe] hydrogenase H-cluster maturation GTPase HydF [Treponema sp.]
MDETPLAESVSIVLAGNRNAGKSSLLNAIFQKDVAIVSSTPGTTTDPVTRKIELGKLGACSVTDTAGLDDEGELGVQRIEKTKERLTSADLVLFVSPQDKPVTQSERELLSWIEQKKLVYIGVKTFADRTADESKLHFFPAEKTVTMCTASGARPDIAVLLEKIESMENAIRRELTPVEGIVHEGEFVMLVTPIDLAAPAGRLILPQVETIRDLLDRDCSALIVKERELYDIYHSIGRKPELVITDSQAFSKVAADIDDDQKLTSFSILFARKKGDPLYFIESLKTLSHFPKGGRVLIMEACSHHRQADDLGTVKIPRLFRQLVDSEAVFEHVRHMPDHPEEYDMIIHCAGCMITQHMMNAKIEVFKHNRVPVLNYGMFLAWANGLMPRALEPFPDLYNAYKHTDLMIVNK